MPGHTFETFKHLGLQGTTFKPRVPPVRGDMVIFKNAKNTQTTAWRVLTEPTEHTCKALASVEAPTLRNTYDFPPIFS